MYTIPYLHFNSLFIHRIHLLPDLKTTDFLSLDSKRQAFSDNNIGRNLKGFEKYIYLEKDNLKEPIRRMKAEGNYEKETD